MFYLVAILGLVIDQLSKWYITSHMVLGESIPLWDNVFHITYILNRGAAFGILTDQRLLFLGVAALVIGMALYYRKHLTVSPMYVQVGAGLLVSGALGNAWDRYSIGSVVDFFDFRIWPIFNVADIAICIGITLLGWYVWRYEDKARKTTVGTKCVKE